MFGQVLSGLSISYILLFLMIICKIFFSSVKPLLVDELPDVWIWGPSLADIYSARSVNHWRLHHSDQLLFARDWNWLWKLYLPSYIQFFLWKLCHGVVPSRSLLQHGGIISSDICRVCNFQPESIFHSLFSCKYAAATWAGYGLSNFICLHDPIDWFQWTKQNCLDFGFVVPVIFFFWF